MYELSYILDDLYFLLVELILYDFRIFSVQWSLMENFFIGGIVIGCILHLSNLWSFFFIKSSNNLDLFEENCCGEFCKLCLVDGIESCDLDDLGSNCSKLIICSEWIFNCISAYAACANIHDILDEL